MSLITLSPSLQSAHVEGHKDNSIHMNSELQHRISSHISMQPSKNEYSQWYHSDQFVEFSTHLVQGKATPKSSQVDCTASLTNMGEYWRDQSSRCSYTSGTSTSITHHVVSITSCVWCGSCTLQSVARSLSRTRAETYSLAAVTLTVYLCKFEPYHQIITNSVAESPVWYPATCWSRLIRRFNMYMSRIWSWFKKNL